jgi:DNA-binding SARP family transcriptional activator
VLDFGVLGPLRVVVDGHLTPIGPRKHRILLASLLLRPGRPVYLDELIDWLWPSQPPAQARRTVQTYTMRLRRELGAAGRLIKTRPEAYSIELAPEHLDLGRFVQLTERAAEHRAAGNPVGARAHLRRALAQWRGAPLADVPSAALAHATVPHLLELRCRAMEQRIELDLELGSADDLVGELRMQVAEQPLRERFWALLMRALSHAGRHAEALAAYDEVNRLLGDELGAEPGQELRRLHAEVLAGTATTAPATNAKLRANLERLRQLLAEALTVVTAVTLSGTGMRRG